MSRWTKEIGLKYCSPTPKIIISGVGFFFAFLIIEMAEYSVNKFYHLMQMNRVADYTKLIRFMIGMTVFLFGFAILEYAIRSDECRIMYIIRRRLCDPSFGNPLQLKCDEIEPHIKVSKTDRGFKIMIECQSAKFDDVASLETTISDSLRNRFGDYAVVSKEEDIAGRYVDYYIENVVERYNKQSVYTSLADVPSHLTRIFITDDIYIDLAKVLNASAIIAGRSRSGKTTAITSTFLLPILKQARDDFGSRIIIVDPKCAELSLCPHVLSPDENGSVEHILDAIRDYNRIRIERQRILNDYCRKTGKAAKWYDIGVKPCVLFLDEYISLQDMFPKKASKEKPDYSLADFQGLLRQIATQGASAGCFLILSTAEASVGTGGLESAVNNACGIRILFKPSKDEARFLWGSDKLEVLRERQYSAGDAWFSADDGINNSVRFVKFPRLEFGEYRALSELLSLYYCDNECSASCGAKKRSTVPVPD